METEKAPSNINQKIYVNPDTGERFTFVNGALTPIGNSAPAALDVMSATAVDDSLNAGPFPRDFAIDDSPIMNQVAPEMVAPNPGGSTEGALESNASRPGRSTGGRSGRVGSQANSNPNERIFVDPDGVRFKFVGSRLVPVLENPIVNEVGMTILDNFSNLVENVPNAFIDFANDTKNFGLVSALATRAPFTGVPRDAFRGALSEAEPAIPNIPQFFDVPGAEDIVAAGEELMDDQRSRLFEMTGQQSPFGTGEDMTIPERAQRIAGERFAARQEYPKSTFFAGLLGDGLSLGLTRNVSGVSKKMVKRNVDRSVREAGLDMLPLRTYDQLKEVGKLGSLKNFFGRFGKSASPALSKIAEAGVEGYLLGLMKEQDPLELAAFGAGTQAAGSAAINLLEEPIRKMGERMTGSRGLVGLGAGLGISSFAVGSLYQAAKAIPGVDEKDYILESIESGYGKAAFAALVSGAATRLGAGRPGSSQLNEELLGNFEEVADLLNAVPRAGVISAIGEAFKDPVAARVIETVEFDPYFFGESAGRRLDRALRDESISLVETIEDLRDTDENFRDNLRFMNNRFDAAESAPQVNLEVAPQVNPQVAPQVNPMGQSTGGRSGRVNNPVQSAPGLLLPQANNPLDAQG